MDMLFENVCTTTLKLLSITLPFWGGQGLSYVFVIVISEKCINLLKSKDFNSKRCAVDIPSALVVTRCSYCLQSQILPAGELSINTLQFKYNNAKSASLHYQHKEWGLLLTF